MKKVKNLPTPGFVSHDYVQHKDRERRGGHCTRYRSYLVLQIHDSLHVTDSAYEGSIADVSGMLA